MAETGGIDGGPVLKRPDCRVVGDKNGLMGYYHHEERRGGAEQLEVLLVGSDRAETVGYGMVPFDVCLAGSFLSRSFLFFGMCWRWEEDRQAGRQAGRTSG